MKIRRIPRMLWAAAGFVTFGLGAVGTVVPILPTTPFLLVAAFCFARSSARVNSWFKSTKLYHAVIEGYATKRRMTVRSKLYLLVPITVVLAISFLLMGAVPVGRAVVAVVWVAHIVYFGFIVKTDRGDAPAPSDPAPSAHPVACSASAPAALEPSPESNR